MQQKLKKPNQLRKYIVRSAKAEGVILACMLTSMLELVYNMYSRGHIVSGWVGVNCVGFHTFDLNVSSSALASKAKEAKSK